MKNWSILIIFSFTLISCKEVLDEDVTGMEPKIVLEYKLNNTNQLNFAKVSSTTDYYLPQTSPEVSDAIISITNGLLVDTFIMNKPGVYHQNTNFQKSVYGYPLNTYTLKVVVKGKTYMATSAMPHLTKIDSIGFFYNPNAVLTRDAGYYPIIYFTDDPNEENYYKFGFYGNAGTNSVISDIFIISDKMGIGNAIGFESPYAYQKNDRVYIELRSITKATYEFYFGVNQQMQNDGSFFSSPPANIKGNFDNDALGLFEVYSVDTLSVRIP